MENVKEKYLVPMIGLGNCGKSTFLNTLINIDDNILETGDQGKTNFVCIIRYNENLNEPEFYHVSIEKKEGKIFYIEKDERIKGLTKIKEEIKNLNNKYENEKNFQNLYYILEIKMNIPFIKDSKFFEKYDLVDIPGLDNEKIKIIDNIKENIKFCIYMINSKYYKDNIDIIKEVNKICNLNFNNSLIILSKIDEIKNKKDIMKRFKTLLMENFGDNVYDNSNTIMKLDSICLKYEIMAQNNFEYLLRYYWRKSYFEKDANEKSFLKIIEKSFLKIIEKTLFEMLMSNKNFININNLDEFCKTMANKVNSDESDEILKIIKKLESDNIPIKYKRNKNYIHSLYQCFKEKLIIISESKMKKKINDYFEKTKEITKRKSIEKVKENKKENKKEINIINILNQFKIFFNENFKNLSEDNNLDEYTKECNKIIYFMEKGKLSVPIFGCYNSGKSTTINSFIGDDILPTNEDENTRTIIFIRHNNIEEPILYKAKLLEDNNEYKKNRYYLEKDEDFSPIIGKKRIKSFIDLKNDILAKLDNNEKNEKNEKNEIFYILETKIKMLEELKLHEDLKNKIEFIDIPGLNVNGNLFNKYDGSLQEIVSVSSLFIFVIPMDKPITDPSNEQILNHLYSNIKTILGKDIIDSSLFLINKCEDKQIELGNIKKELNKFLKKKINLIQKYSSLKTLEFIKTKEFYENFNLNEYKKNYIDTMNSESFDEYLINELESKLEEDFDIEYNMTENDEISKKDEKVLKEYCNDKDNVDKIISMLSFGRKNIKTLKSYITSNCDNFHKLLNEILIEKQKELDIFYINRFLEFLKKIELFFNRNQEKIITNEEIKRMENKRKELDQSLKDCLKECNLINLLNTVNNSIEQEIFIEYKRESEQKMKGKDIKELEKEIREKIDLKLKDFEIQFNKERELFLLKIQNIIINIYNNYIPINEKRDLLEKNELLKLFNENDLIKEKVIMLGLGGVGTAIGGGITILCETALSGLMGGIFGLAIGVVIGGSIFISKGIYNYVQKKDNYNKLLNTIYNQYTAIFDAVKFNVQNNIKELVNHISNLISLISDLLTNNISKIKTEVWGKSKAQFLKLFEEYKKNLLTEYPFLYANKDDFSHEIAYK